MEPLLFLVHKVTPQMPCARSNARLIRYFASTTHLGTKAVPTPGSEKRMGSVVSDVAQLPDLVEVGEYLLPCGLIRFGSGEALQRLRNHGRDLHRIAVRVVPPLTGRRLDGIRLRLSVPAGRLRVVHPYDPAWM